MPQPYPLFALLPSLPPVSNRRQGTLARVVGRSHQELRLSFLWENPKQFKTECYTIMGARWAHASENKVVWERWQLARPRLV